MSRIVSIFGATGTQGSSVVRAILQDETFTARAITRDITSQAAKELISQGAQVVQADGSDEESVKEALQGSEAVFIVTVPFKPVSEKPQATNIINAAKVVGVKYIVWSSLPAPSKVSNGEITSLTHWDGKAEIDDILRASGIPHSIVHTTWFFENFWKFANVPGFPPLFKRDTPSGDSYTLSLVRAEDRLQTFSYISRDLGASVLALLKSYDDEGRKGKVLGETFLVATERITGEDFAATLSKVLGKPVNFVSLPDSGLPPINDLADFLRKFWKKPEENGVPDRRLVDLGVRFSSAQEFVEDNKEKLLAL